MVQINFCSNCPDHTFVAMTDPSPSPVAPATIAELVVAPVQTFGGDTKKTRAAFFQARALLFAECASETRTLGVVKCGGDGNGHVCAYVRPLVVPSRSELMGTAALPEDPLLSDSWPLDALEAMRSRCSRVVELPQMRAPLSSVTRFNQKMLDGFVTGHHKCHTRGVGKRRSPSSTGSVSSGSVSTPCSSNTASPIASPVGTSESRKRARYGTPLSTSSSPAHTPTKDQTLMDQEQDEDFESDHESEAAIIEEQLCHNQVQLLRSGVKFSSASSLGPITGPHSTAAGESSGEKRSRPTQNVMTEAEIGRLWRKANPVRRTQNLMTLEEMKEAGRRWYQANPWRPLPPWEPWRDYIIE